MPAPRGVIVHVPMLRPHARWLARGGPRCWRTPVRRAVAFFVVSALLRASFGARHPGFFPSRVLRVLP
jgi:hypothetical protein